MSSWDRYLQAMESPAEEKPKWMNTDINDAVDYMHKLIPPYQPASADTRLFEPTGSNITQQDQNEVEILWQEIEESLKKDSQKQEDSCSCPTHLLMQSGCPKKRGNPSCSE